MSFRSCARVKGWLGASGVLGVLGLAAPAHATFFSFASDNNQQQPTFISSGAGGGGSFAITSPVSNSFSLLIDDNNGPLPQVSVPTRLVTNLSATSAGVSGFGAMLTYYYRVSGTMDFVDPGSGTLFMRLTLGVGDGAGLMSITGTQTEWGESGGIFGSDSFSVVDYDVTAAGYNAFAAAAGGLGQSIADYFIFAAGPSIGPDDFSFTLTALTQPGGAPVPVSNNLPTAGFQSESSYSGKTGLFIPGPSGAALLAGAGLMAFRRRR